MTDQFRIDSHKLHFHPERVAQWLNADTWDKAKKVYPIYWEITTAANCNHRCTFCSVDSIGYPDIQIDADILICRMEEAQELGVKSVMFAGTGEPLLHPEITQIASGAAYLAGLDVAFTTNGIRLDRFEAVDACEWIKVSLNAGSKESYAKIHKTNPRDWDKVWANIENACQRRGKWLRGGIEGQTAIGVQCVVLPENHTEMDALAQKAKSVGADYLVLKPYSQGTFSIVKRDDIDYQKMHAYLKLIPAAHNTQDFKVIYREESMKQESEKHHYDKCRATPIFWCYTMADGRMFSCSAHLLDDRFCLGNINTQSFQEIWEGEKRRQNWEMMKKFDISNCRLNCRFDKQNRYLHELDSGVPHLNFV